MPTITQLPPAASVDPADRLLLDKGGDSLSMTTALLLQGTQPRLALASGSLLGRVSGGTGGPEPIRLGSGLRLQNGSLQVDPSVIGDGGGGQTGGGSLAGADVSASVLKATGTPTSRTLAQRAAERLNLLDFGADPSGAADCGSAFAAAMASVQTGGTARVFVPRGVYRLGGIVEQPAGLTITVEFDDGALLAGPGYLAVDRVESHQGAFRISQVSDGFAGFASSVGNAANLPFDYQIMKNTPTNSASARVAWARNYQNLNRYNRYNSGIDFAEQNIYSWARLVDNTSGWGHWEVVTGATYDEDTAARARLSASAEHSEFDVVNNGPEHGWTHRSGIGTLVQGMSMDPWGQNGLYGGSILYAYGTVGGFDGEAGGVNHRWINYPAAHSVGNPPAVRRNGVISIGLDLTAKATASLSGAGVAAISVIAGGGAYTNVPTVVLTGGGGSGAVAVATVVGGAVVRVSIASPGAGYTTPPTVSFVGGGVSAAGTTSVTLNADGAHGDLNSVAAAIRAAAIPMVSAAVTTWGGAVSRLVIFGLAPGDVGTLTLGGSALGDLGIAAGSVATPRDDTAIAFGARSGVAAGDSFTLNGYSVTVGGTGMPADIAAAVNALGQPGLAGDVTADGRLVLTAWLPQQPCGLVLAQASGATVLGKLAISPGVILPPTPPKAFATAAGEVGANACNPGDAIRLSATDLAGTNYGPVTAVVGGTGSVADVVVALRAALQGAGFLSNGLASLTSAPSVVAIYLHNSGPTAGLVIRNTAGGTLTLANAAGTPLDTLGLVTGTYQPGGYSPGSQTVFHAAPNSVAPQGRGMFIGGSTVPDPTVWPHAPMEARGSFAHGLRTDRASFGDGCALLLGSGQAIGWGVAGPALSVAAGRLVSTAPASLPGLMLTALPTSPAGLPSGSVWNNGGVLSIA